MSRSTLRREAHMKGQPQPEFDGREATIPANPTDQIAATTATRGDIASHEGDATIPAVVQAAQRYDYWREDLDSIEACEEISECADGCCTFFTPRHNDECIRLAAHIERPEAEVEDALTHVARVEATNEKVIAERDALLAEHEAGVCPVCHMRSTSGYYRDEHGLGHVCTHAYHAAHDNAERVIRGE